MFIHYSRVCIGTKLFDTFSIQNGLKQEDTILPLLFKSALQYAIMKVQDSEEGLQTNGTQKPTLYAHVISMEENNE